MCCLPFILQRSIVNLTVMNEAPMPKASPAEPAVSAISTPPSTSAGASILLGIFGILFIFLWIIAHLAWGAMAFIADVMANDSGRADPDKHMMLIFGMMGGQVLCGAAGVPAGLAFFWRGRRKLLLLLFAVLFVVGALIQGGVFYSFFSSMP